jgi:K+-transporting ATPase ATPase C chain
VLFAALSLITGLAYPLAVTGVAQATMAAPANGSLVWRDGQAVGSRLIGQPFSDPAHFWGRPSATTPMPDNAANSGGSNLGPSNPALVAAVKARIQALRAADPGQTAPVPIDLVTASASGLDPHISVAAAQYQLPRIARLRGVPVAALQDLGPPHRGDTAGVPGRAAGERAAAQPGPGRALPIPAPTPARPDLTL